jgi:hypothetical protein
MLKFISRCFAAVTMVAVPLVFCSCDKVTSEKSKEVTTTETKDGATVKKEETSTTTTTKDK